MNNKDSSFTANEHIVDIHGLSHDGRGIGAILGKTTFVNGAMVGEKILCKISRKHHRYNEAQVIEILEPSPERTQPHCAHFGVCGGCSLQHFSQSRFTSIAPILAGKRLKNVHGRYFSKML